MTQLRVLVVSLDRLSRAGLAAVLDQQPNPIVVGQISGDEIASLSLDVYRSDVIVWDVSWDTAAAVDGLGFLPEDAPPVLALAATENQAAQARAAGIQSILSRESSPEALASAITALSHGLQISDPALPESAAPNIGDSNSLLTPREQDVLRLLAEGLPTRVWPRASK